MKNLIMDERPTHTTIEDYCIPVGVLDASFTLAKDTFCSVEGFDLISNPQLLSGESVWQITGPDNFTYVVKDTLGVKLNKAGSYTILHLHKVAFCTDSFSRNITVLGGSSTVSITTCDTVRASQISNCPFTWPNGSSDSIYVAISNGTWNINTQCAVCTSNVAVQVTVTPKPYLLEKAADVCEGQTLPYTLKGQYITDVLWYDGNTGLSHPFDSAGTYALMLYNKGCTQADTLAVTLLDCRTCDIYLPNAFTPNNDGNNDAFGAYTSCTQIIQFNLQIYNRWGEKVYETNDLDAKWDGRYKGEAAPAATYVYQVGISYTTTNNAETRKYKGSVMLIR
jgi:gliding motility-associated-like protein